MCKFVNLKKIKKLITANVAHFADKTEDRGDNTRRPILVSCTSTSIINYLNNGRSFILSRIIIFFLGDMKSKPFYLICFQLFAITESLVEKNPTRKSVYGRNNHHQASLLSAIPTSSSYRNSGGSVPPSNTACESAVNVEWEPMSNLQRRIEDGVNYEHIPSAANHHDESQRHTRMPGCHSKAKRITENEDDDSPGIRAVFCGYKYTQDDYNRLKAADVA